jgi:hypothetical protein
LTLCRRGRGVEVVRAAAGTGKTFVLDAAREAWQASGLEVIGCAISARAALELADQSGIPSMTIASLWQRLDRGETVPHRSVLVVDEAGMVGTRALAALAAAADQAGAKLVLVGDDRQLPEIAAGGAFHALAERLDATQLREVRRQREAWDRDALDALRNGEVERWARAYRDRGRITIADSASAARAALVNDWSRADGDRLMIAARRQDVRDLNERARDLLRSKGAIGEDELEVGDRSFAVGDRVVGRRNDRGLGIVNGQRGTVRAIDVEGPSVEVELDGGARVRLPAEYLGAGHLDHGYAVTAHRAQGATVDRAFVLGSDQLYREWGYTAMSRHREESRFYVTRSALDFDRDRAPEPDPIVAGIGRLLGRSRAKELALGGLTEAPEPDLRRERDALTAPLQDDPPPQPQTARLASEVERLGKAVQAARDREAALQDRQARLSWFDRRGRRQIDAQLERASNESSRLTERWQRAHFAHDVASAAERGWILEHGGEGSRLLAVDHELRLREHIDRTVARRLDDLRRLPDPLERGVDLPSRELRHGLDMRFD